MLISADLSLLGVEQPLALVTIGRRADGEYECQLHTVSDVEAPIGAAQTANLLRWLADAIEIDAL